MKREDMAEFKEQLDKLAELQKIDSEIYDESSALESFPEKIAEMDASLEGKKSGMEEAEEKLKAIQVAKNEKETEMQAKEDQITKLQGDLNQIKNNKEYKAILSEIDSIKADISLLEEDIINLIDDIEAAKAGCEEEKKKFEQEKKLVEAEKSRIHEEESRLKASVDKLRQQREGFSKEITPDVLEVYQRILSNRGRMAISNVHGEFCSECNMHLRPQMINDASLKNKLVMCENCSRILYVEED
ncbi:MAG: hypothetical protein GF408_00495 [Candidatus Omnitrophica bacterium]|nr:hypothetical protein [Candidatus Omnitrophota bacterium]